MTYILSAVGGAEKIEYIVFMPSTVFKKNFFYIVKLICCLHFGLNGSST